MAMDMDVLDEVGMGFAHLQELREGTRGDVPAAPHDHEHTLL